MFLITEFTAKILEKFISIYISEAQRNVEPIVTKESAALTGKRRWKDLRTFPNWIGYKNTVKFCRVTQINYSYSCQNLNILLVIQKLILSVDIGRSFSKVYLHSTLISSIFRNRLLSA